MWPKIKILHYYTVKFERGPKQIDFMVFYKKKKNIVVWLLCKEPQPGLAY